MRKQNVLFFMVFFFIVPFCVTAQSEEEKLFDVKIEKVHATKKCDSQKKCDAFFLIEGKNFVSSHPQGRVKIGEDWLKILTWSDTRITGTTSLKNKEKIPLVIVEKKIERPILQTKDPILKKMFEESVDVAIASVKQDVNKRRYFVAGPKYTMPERTYYRDSYWSSGLMLFIEPVFVRDQILLLARGVEKDGSTPSAIPVNPSDRKIPLWTNHYDSGSYFIMMVYDYIRYTGDTSILFESVNKRTVFETMHKIVSYLESQDKDKNFLPEKPKNSMQDWLDSIPRGGEVISNEVLYYQALRELSEITERFGKKDLARAYDRRSLLVRNAINERFWNEEEKMYQEHCEGSVCVNRLTNESALAILFGVIDPNEREPFFQTLQKLETRNNKEFRLHGDIGVLNAYPFYENVTQPFLYQNGTDWPFLDGINAGARLKYQNRDWYYPLTRWFVYFQDLKKPHERLPEYISPIDKGYGIDQAWSTYPITAFLRYGLGLDPDLQGKYSKPSSLIGETSISNVLMRGKRIQVEIK